MTPQGAQQLPHRSIVWDGVGDGLDPHKAVASFTVAAELAAQIHIRLLRVLLLIQAVLVGLPHIEQRIWNRAPVGGKHSPHHHNWFAAL